MTFIPLQNDPDDTSHTSDEVFPELPDDVRPVAAEWEDCAGFVQTMCGCMVEIFPGDTIWTIVTPDGHTAVVAIDPVTVH